MVGGYQGTATDVAKGVPLLNTCPRPESCYQRRQLAGTAGGGGWDERRHGAATVPVRKLLGRPRANTPLRTHISVSAWCKAMIR